MKTIQLTQGYFTIVNDQDYELVKNMKWCVAKNRGRLYACRSTREVPRLLHTFIMNPPVGKLVDHIDGNGLNNLRSNLRFATMSQNIANSRKRKDNTTGYKGVSWFAGSKHPNGVWKSKPAWTARIGVNGKRKTLGYFKTKEEAALAYNEAALKYHGEFAKLNPL